MKKGVKNIQGAAYNGTHTCVKYKFDFGKELNPLWVLRITEQRESVITLINVSLENGCQESNSWKMEMTRGNSINHIVKI